MSRPTAMPWLLEAQAKTRAAQAEGIHGSFWVPPEKLQEMLEMCRVNAQSARKGGGQARPVEAPYSPAEIEF